MTNGASWSGIDEKYDLDDVYLKEVKVGKTGQENEVTYDDAKWDDPASVTGTYASAYHNYEVTYAEKQEILGEQVFTVRNRRVNTVNLTVTKLWKDNNGTLRKELEEALKNLPRR